MDDPATNTPKPESVGEKIKAAFKDLVGLPPGDGTTHGKGAPDDDKGEPRNGGLTSDDAEGLPPHSGTGIGVD